MESGLLPYFGTRESDFFSESRDDLGDHQYRTNNQNSDHCFLL